MWKLQPSDGNTVSRGPKGSWQIDLASLHNSPAEKAKYTKCKADSHFKFFLVVINTFDRVVYTGALKTKEPSEVKVKLSQIIEEAPKKSEVIISDNGNGILGEVSTYLKSKGIAQRSKTAGDQNAIGSWIRQFRASSRFLHAG